VKGVGSAAALIVLMLAAAAPRMAVAADEPVALAGGPGRDLTIGRCIICHSVEYIPSNAPAMNRAGWQKTIQKMKERFGAPITDEESQVILDYLDGHYSGKT
jgi:sulfite dehydrogenase (cytochrome) subunit B